MDENVPDPLAQLDQALRMMADWGRLMYAHYEACVVAGFDERQALALTVAYQSAMQATGAA